MTKRMGRDMNYLSDEILQKVQIEALYNIYLYLIHKMSPNKDISFQEIIHDLEYSFTKNPQKWNNPDIQRLNILKNAISSNNILANSKICDLTYSKNGLTACSFARPCGNISVVFKGTGSGEWIDNGEGLSGIPEENTYITYSKNGSSVHSKTVKKDYATDQQVEALNWFRKIVAENEWSFRTSITVSGHSKGGNKAQFVAINSDLVDDCYSFDGQGFSPEALIALKKQYGAKYEERRQRIRSFCANNDYVNVLGKYLVPENHIYYFDSRHDFHYLEAILNENGSFRVQKEQGNLSQYVQKLSDELMNMNPLIRQYATLGIMNIFQKYLGKGEPVNQDSVSIEKTIAGLGIAIGTFLQHLPKIKK